jgi:hypothetical protein
MAQSMGGSLNVSLQTLNYVFANSGLFNSSGANPRYSYETVNVAGDFIGIDSGVSSGQVDIIFNTQGLPSSAAPASRISLLPGESYFGQYNSFTILASHQEVAAGRAVFGWGKKRQNNHPYPSNHGLIGSLAASLNPRTDIGVRYANAALPNVFNDQTIVRMPLKDLTTGLPVSNPRAIIFKDAKISLVGTRVNHFLTTYDNATNNLLPPRLISSNTGSIANSFYAQNTAFVTSGSEYEMINMGFTVQPTVAGINTIQSAVYTAKNDLIMVLKNRIPVDLEPGATTWEIIFQYATNVYGPYMSQAFQSLLGSYTATTIFIA